MSLGRELMFTDQFELSAYTKGNLLNTELYKAYLSIKDNTYRWKHSPVDTFNEVYYQCTRVYNDPNPESDLWGTYLNDARDTFGTRYASDMIFSMVSAIFDIMSNKPDNVDFFQAELKALMKNNIAYFQPYEQFAKDFILKYGKQHLEFPYTPVPPKQIAAEELINFKSLTHDYEEFYIRQLVDRYKSVEDKLALIDLIERAYKDDNNLNAVEADMKFMDLPF